MGTIKLELTTQEINIIVTGLMELQGKTMHSVLRKIDAKVTQQVKQ